MRKLSWIFFPERLDADEGDVLVALGAVVQRVPARVHQQLGRGPELLHHGPRKDIRGSSAGISTGSADTLVDLDQQCFWLYCTQAVTIKDSFLKWH